MSPRRSGVLLHPTSLPGRFGIGDLGPQAIAWVEHLADMAQGWWQVLPLTPTSVGDSPYFSPSAFAGNPLLISPLRLHEDGWLDEVDLASAPEFPVHRVDYGAVGPWKRTMLATAFRHYEERATFEEKARFDGFIDDEHVWLDDYALFMAIKEEQGGLPWTDWPTDLLRREEQALEATRERLASRIRLHQFGQYLFFEQWRGLKAYANSRNVRLIGDAPIFVAHDSADVWAHPALWRLDERGHPLVVAGVPPDYFSATGQLWGNPHYDWGKMAETNYAWWAARLRSLLRLVDLIRLDHFRGFAGFWEIPAGEPTAVNGRWVPGPGAALFEALKDQLGDLPLIAEDLGVITPDVVELRDRFGLPGMKILQFAFDAAEENNYFPHLYPRNCVVYPGTHDNDTSRGWYEKAKPEDKALMAEYIGKERIAEPSWELIRLGHASVADLSVVPLQDLLGLGSEARTNTPGTMGGNWAWRFEEGDLTPAIKARFDRMTRLYDREPL
ncbi:4-alpha-glucanotransferase [compost metagenome]